MRGIGFYGKGGIGKSTTISNVIAALSMKDRKILQIGCDPKHDSARLLLGGFTQTTVLEQLNITGSVSLDAVMLTGYNQVKCIESGGPEPGVGCAGRGIIQTLQLLKDQGLDTKQFDYVFFDVLGDVVCGGFAVPMREGYADEVYIVSSGEIASLYAANNIAKGLQRFTSNKGKLGGIIGNLRGIDNECQILDVFAKKVGTEIVAFIPRNVLIPQAELASKTIMEFAPNTELATIYSTIADYIEHHFNPVIPTPLSDTELEEFLQEFCYGIKKTKINSVQTLQTAINNTFKPPVTQNVTTCQNNLSSKKSVQVSAPKERPPVYGCSLTGAYDAISQIQDVIALMYSPQGCAYINYCTHQSALSSSDSPYVPNLLCTNMQETDVVFGGTKHLEETLLSMQKRFPDKQIFLIPSCPVGLIGDDINSLVSKLNMEKQRILYIPADGVIGGDFYAGMFTACKFIAEKFIDKTITPVNDVINIIGEQNLSTTADPNFKEIHQILTALGIKINCRFLRQTSIEEIKNFRKAKFNLPLTDSQTVHDLSVFLDKNFGTETLHAPLPIGFDQTAEFTRVIARKFGKEAIAEKIISEAQTRYENDRAQLKPFFVGKKALINSNGANIDWLQLALNDLDVDVTVISTFNVFAPEEKTLPALDIDSSKDSLEEAIRLNQPDFVLSALHRLITGNIPFDFFPVLPLYGFNSGLDYAKKLYFKLKIPFIEGWRYDNDE